MKAPSDIDSPAQSASAAVPTTSSKAVAVNTSGVFAPPTMRKIGRTRKLPPTRIAATAARPRATASQGISVGTGPPDRSGTSATKGMKAMSWNSRTAKLSRPAVEESRFRSPSMGNTMAVEDSAKPAPMMAAPAHGTPAT